MVEHPRKPPSDPAAAPATAFARAQGGEPVLAELIAENLGRLRAFVRAHMGPALRAHESDLDLLQSVCGELLAARGRFDFRGEAQFRAFLFTAARNKMIERVRYLRAARRDAARERQADTSVQQQLVDGRHPAPSAAAAAGERAARVAAALEELAPEYREVVTLTQFAGLTPGDLAEHFGRSPDAVRMLLGRAMAKLATMLGRHGVGPDDLASI